MKWTYKFETPIMLKDGRSIVSLVHARDLLIDLPALRAERPHWQQTTDRLFEAARTGRPDTIAWAYTQLMLALKTDGLV